MKFFAAGEDGDGKLRHKDWKPEEQKGKGAMENDTKPREVRAKDRERAVTYDAASAAARGNMQTEEG